MDKATIQTRAMPKPSKPIFIKIVPDYVVDCIWHANFFYRSVTVFLI